MDESNTLEELFATDGGISFGFTVEIPRGEPPPDLEDHPARYIGDRHILTYAPSGSGKSRRLLLSNILMLPNWSLVIIDIKGELAEQTRLYRKHMAENHVVMLNPFNVLDMGSDGYNPVAALQLGPNFIDDAMGLAEAIIRVENERDTHWTTSAQDLLCALIMYSRITEKDGGSLGHVRSVLGKPANEFGEEIAKMIEVGIKENVDELGIKASRFLDMNPDNRELHSILSTAMTQTRFLDSPPLKEHLSKGEFDWKSLKERPTTVYINLPANRLNTHSSYMRIVISDFLQSILRDSRTPKVPILIMLDEIAQIGDLPILRNSLALVRSYGCKYWQLWQDSIQHRSVNGPFFESAVANSGVLQAFAPQDISTAKLLSERAGQTTAEIASYSEPVGLPTSRPSPGNVSVAYAPIPGLLPQELMRMGEGYQVIFSHKTEDFAFAYCPDPSEVASLDDILTGGRNSRR